MKQSSQNASVENSGVCPRCGSARLNRTLDEVEFDYGGRDKPFRVKATFPFITCRECGLVSVDGIDEDLQHEAACRHLGVMTPEEIKALRDKLGLTQEGLAELTGLGVASIRRWEGGLVIQNEACDRLLNLLTFADNVERLRARTAGAADPPPAPPHNRIKKYVKEVKHDPRDFQLHPSRN